MSENDRYEDAPITPQHLWESLLRLSPDGEWVQADLRIRRIGDQLYLDHGAISQNGAKVGGLFGGCEVIGVDSPESC